MCEVEKVRCNHTIFPTPKTCDMYVVDRLQCMMRNTGNVKTFMDTAAKTTGTFFSELLSDIHYLNDFTNGLLSEHLTRWVNTWLQAGTWSPQIMRMDQYNLPDTRLFIDYNPVWQMNITEAVFPSDFPIYQKITPCIATLLFTPTILLLMGLANIFISFTTLAPDCFTCVSAFTRDNPYAKVLGCSGLEGSERSRVLRKMKVQIADAKPEDDVGHVVLKNVEDENEFLVRRLKKGRLYE